MSDEQVNNLPKISDLDEIMKIAIKTFNVKDNNEDAYVAIEFTLNLLIKFEFILNLYIAVINIPNKDRNKVYSAPVYKALQDLITYCSLPNKIKGAPFSAFQLAYGYFRDMQRVPNTRFTFGQINTFEPV